MTPDEKREPKERKKWEFPDTYVLIAALLFLAVLATWVLPAGSYERVYDEAADRDVVQAGTYAAVESNPASIGDFFLAVPQGLVKNASTVFFIFIIGGCFGVVNRTGALTGLISQTIRRSKGGKGSGERVVILLLLLVFGLAGGVVGMAEECMMFLPVLVMLSIGLGYDAVVGTAIMMFGVACGYGCAPVNPFTVGLAQSIAGLPMFSGMWLRWILWACGFAWSIFYVLRYCRRIQADPSRSLVADCDYEEFQMDEAHMGIALRKREIGVLVSFFGGIAVLVVMIILKGWYMTELTAYFFFLAILCGVVYGMGPNTMAKAFVEGMQTMTYPAILVGIATGISVVLENGLVLDTIVHGLSQILNYTPRILNGGLMMLVQSAINFFIPSGTGQAAVTMPLMAPLADVIDITRQTSVLAFQLGDGCSNAIIPTGAMLMGSLAISKVPYVAWVKFAGKWLVGLLAIGFAFCVFAVAINYGPF